MSKLFAYILVCISIMAGITAGHMWGTLEMQRDAIKHDAAVYDGKTGEWKWVVAIPELSDKEQDEINKACKALGSKKNNDPKCILMGR